MYKYLIKERIPSTKFIIIKFLRLILTIKHFITSTLTHMFGLFMYCKNNLSCKFARIICWFQTYKKCFVLNCYEKVKKTLFFSLVCY